jgi:hypothetical protein
MTDFSVSASHQFSYVEPKPVNGVTGSASQCRGSRLVNDILFVQDAMHPVFI